MLAVGASCAKVETMLMKVRCGRASVACMNSPSLVIVSGNETAKQALEKAAELQTLFTQKLPLNIAYHSHHTDAIADY